LMNFAAKIDPYIGSGLSCLRLAVMRPINEFSNDE
jgi:hypothetical protein